MELDVLLNMQQLVSEVLHVALVSMVHLSVHASLSQVQWTSQSWFASPILYALSVAFSHNKELQSGQLTACKFKGQKICLLLILARLPLNLPSSTWSVRRSATRQPVILTISGFPAYPFIYVASLTSHLPWNQNFWLALVIITAIWICKSSHYAKSTYLIHQWD